MANNKNSDNKIYITISKQEGTGGDGEGTKNKKKTLEERYQEYLVHKSLDLISSKTISAVNKSVARIGSFKGDYIGSNELQYSLTSVKASINVGMSALAGAKLGGVQGAVAGALFAFSSIAIDNVQDIIDYRQAYNKQQYEIDMLRQRSGLNSTTNGSRTGD